MYSHSTETAYSIFSCNFYIIYSCLNLLYYNMEITSKETFFSINPVKVALYLAHKTHVQQQERKFSFRFVQDTLY